MQQNPVHHRPEKLIKMIRQLDKSSRQARTYFIRPNLGARIGYSECQVS